MREEDKKKPAARIMVVEDEGVVSIDIRNMLMKAGYGIAAVAFKGEEAVHKAEKAKPDLVLMDIGLKGEIDGIEAAKKIRERFHIPVVFLTGFADESTLARAKEVNPSGFIIKPINEEELKRILEQSLAGAAR
jgi:DNA-binding NarL/FixJ family response regulator